MTDRVPLLSFLYPIFSVFSPKVFWALFITLPKFRPFFCETRIRSYIYLSLRSSYTPFSSGSLPRSHYIQSYLFWTPFCTTVLGRLLYFIMHPKVQNIVTQIMGLPGFGTVTLRVVIYCDCNILPGLPPPAHLQGHIIPIPFCLRASLAGLADQLIDWSLGNSVDVFLNCRFGSAYTPGLNM